jgi:hypothetical protein
MRRASRLLGDFEEMSNGSVHVQPRSRHIEELPLAVIQSLFILYK